MLYLAEHYIAEHNRRYARGVESADYHRRTPTARQLDQVFWLEEERVVSEDWVVRCKNCLLQLERQSRHWAPSRSRVLVRENEAGKIQIRYRDHDVLFREVTWASTARSEGRGAAPSPAPPSPKPRSCFRGSSVEKESLSTHEDADLFLGMVKLQPGDTSIVDKAGTFLLWYDSRSRAIRLRARWPLV